VNQERIKKSHNRLPRKQQGAGAPKIREASGYERSGDWDMGEERIAVGAWKSGKQV